MEDIMKLWPGKPYPQGATWDGLGVNFALFSEHATAVELCLFDSDLPLGAWTPAYPRSTTRAGPTTPRSTGSSRTSSRPSSWFTRNASSPAAEPRVPCWRLGVLPLYP